MLWSLLINSFVKYITYTMSIQLNVSLIIEGTICNKGTTAVHFKFSRLWFSESLVTVCQLLEKSGRKFQGFFVDYYRINGKKKKNKHIGLTLTFSAATDVFFQGLFRIAAGASKLKKLKAALDCSTSQLEEFYSDPHAVAGASWIQKERVDQPVKFIMERFPTRLNTLKSSLVPH